MRKLKSYPQNLRILMRAIQGRGIKTAETMIEEEMKVYGRKLKKGRRRRRKAVQC